MKRADFLNPEVEVIEFETKDVITDSPTNDGLIDGGTTDNGPGEGDINWDDIWGN